MMRLTKGCFFSILYAHFFLFCVLFFLFWAEASFAAADSFLLLHGGIALERRAAPLHGSCSGFLDFHPGKR